MKKILLFALIFLFRMNFAYSQSNVITLERAKSYNQNILKGEKNIYEIKLNKGEFCSVEIMQKGVDLVIDLFNVRSEKIGSFDSPNGKQGPEQVEFTADSDGIYRLEIYPLNDTTGIPNLMITKTEDVNQGDYEINPVVILSELQYKKKLSGEELIKNNTIKALKENAHPLKSVRSGNSFEDLEFLKKVLKDVRVVGLGEATHGSKEFFQMKHRMLEFLVKEMGFTVFAMEASYAGCNNINQYVLYGKGDVHSALASQGFWTWDTQEVIDMIEWMRKYNKTVPEDKKVKFTGFDIQINAKGGGFDVVQKYLLKVDSLRSSNSESLFQILRSMDMMHTEGINLDSCKKEYLSLLGFMIMSKGLYVQRSSEEEYENVLRYAETIAQLFDAYFMNETDVRKNEREWRDYYMASNFFNIVQNEKPGTKFVIWAHNGHIDKKEESNVNGGYKPFGSYLYKEFRDEYYAFGFSFSKGSYQAMEFTGENQSKGLQEFTVKEAKQNSLDWYFAMTGYDKFIIDFRDKSLPKILTEFANSEWQSRSSGAISVREFIESYYGPVTINGSFDGMIFIDNTTRANPTLTGMRK